MLLSLSGYTSINLLTFERGDHRQSVSGKIWRLKEDRIDESIVINNIFLKENHHSIFQKLSILSLQSLVILVSTILIISHFSRMKTQMYHFIYILHSTWK